MRGGERFEVGGGGQPSCWPLGPAGSSLVEGVLASTFVLASGPCPCGDEKDVDCTHTSCKCNLLARGHARKQLQRYDGLFIDSYGFFKYPAQDHNIGNSEKE